MESELSYAEQRIAEIQAMKLKRKPHHPHIERWKARNGTTVVYYREGKGSRIRLPDPEKVGPDEFQRAYDAATKGKASETLGRTRGVSPIVTDEIGKPGHIYFVSDGHRVKIGFTTKLKSRIRTLQTGSAEPLQVLMVLPGTEGTERFFHKRFADNRIGGEWFRLVGELEDFVRFKDV